ncbi:MAG TPA: ABC transporter substrate-binding protein [Dissulfurispiraceae bacterium]|nr:ABC transporter substrate-binding protein [Dissulfurispiraceae bacterium]
MSGKIVLKQVMEVQMSCVSKRNSLIMLMSVIFCVFVLTSYQIVYAGEPTEYIRQSVDSVIAIVNNKELQGPGKKTERRAKMREIIDKIFDFREMSKRALALNWIKRTPEEQKEFSSLFADLIEATYASKIEKYNGEKIVYTGESIDDGNAVVKTNIITHSNTEVPLDYRLLKEGANWMVYDVVIEGVSLVNNYRTQFNQIIHSGSYEELVKKMKQKTLHEPK